MIYCVEDDNSIRDLMVYTLRAAEIDAEGFNDGGSFWIELNKNLPDLVILDIMLPGEDGLTILKRLKKSRLYADIPVILATARGAEYDKVLGLDLGADDYLTKPFGMMEMVSRVKAVLRRSVKHGANRVLEHGGIKINLSKHTVTVQDREVLLTLKEYDLLKLFVENPSIVFTRDQLLSTVWGTDFMGESRTVDVHIGTLRTKLGTAGRNIRTVRGVGYRMDEPEQA